MLDVGEVTWSQNFKFAYNTKATSWMLDGRPASPRGLEPRREKIQRLTLAHLQSQQQETSAKVANDIDKRLVVSSTRSAQTAMRYIALVTKPGGADPCDETSPPDFDNNHERGGRRGHERLPSMSAIAKRAQKRLRTGGGIVDRPPAPATVPLSPPDESRSKKPAAAAGGDRRLAKPGRQRVRPSPALPTMMKLRPEAYFTLITGDDLDDYDDVATVDTAASSTVESRLEEPPKPPLEVVRASRPRGKPRCVTI